MTLKDKSEQCRLLLKSKDKKQTGEKEGGLTVSHFFRFFLERDQASL